MLALEPSEYNYVCAGVSALSPPEDISPSNLLMSGPYYISGDKRSRGNKPLPVNRITN